MDELTPGGITSDLASDSDSASPAADEAWDVVVAGGGILGASAAAELAGRGLRTLLVEAADLGGGATARSLRIVHGGLRYLQSADVLRFHESVAARRTFFRAAPDLVEPLSCSMVPDGRGARRTPLLAAALATNDLLGWWRNRGVRRDRHLPRGGVCGGVATWWDGRMIAPSRLLMAPVRRLVASGGRVLSRTQVCGVQAEGGRISGVLLRGASAGERTLACRAVLDCRGGPAGNLPERSAPIVPPTLAFNLLLDRRPPFEGAVAAIDPAPGGPVLFLHAVHDCVFAGTWHAAWPHATPPDRLPEEVRDAFLDALNRALPDLSVEPRHVVRELAGVLPGVAPGEARIAGRPRLVHHAAAGGPAGLVSVSAIKWTTAPRLGRRAAAVVAADLRHRSDDAAPATPSGPDPHAIRTLDGVDLADPQLLASVPDDALRPVLQRLEREEGATGPGDLLLRRTDWGFDPRTALSLVPRLAMLLEWDAARIRAEEAAVAGTWEDGR